MIMKKIAVLTASVIMASTLYFTPVVSAEEEIAPTEIVQEPDDDVTELTFDDREFLKECSMLRGQDEIYSEENGLGPKTILYIAIRMAAENIWFSDKDFESDIVFEERYTSGLYGVGDKETAVEAYQAMINDNPHLFFLAYDIELDDEYIRVSMLPEYKSAEARRKAKQEMYDYVTSTAAEIDKYDTTYEKIAALHNKIAENTEYVETSDISEAGTNACNPMGIINEGRAISDAYARTFNLVLNYMHIENYIAQGKLSDGQRQIWNLVRLDDDKFYNVDCAADDAGGSDKCLFAGNDTIADRALNSHDKTGEDHSLMLPEANKTDYDMPSR